MSTITDEYFGLTKEYIAKYGPRTIVLLQVGAFFEVYGLKCHKTGEITKSNIEMFSQICQLNVSEKNGGTQNIVMAGFRDYTLEKYLQRLSENEYTAVVYVQEKDGKNISRKLDAIYSPGTYISHENDMLPQVSNHIMCIWVEKYTRRGTTNLICGLATANIFTGQSHMFEYETQYYMNPTSFDELERAVSIFTPNEVIINHNLPSHEIESILQFVGLKNATAKNVLIHQNAIETTETAKRCSEQTYIHHVLSDFFGVDAYNVCEVFRNHVIASQAFCFLMHFIQEHNPNLVKNIDVPTFYNTSKHMVLANHSLKQLNIISNGEHSGHLSSVSSFLNKCVSSMGKRKLQQQLLNPVFDTEWLNREYGMIDFLLNQNHYVEVIRKQLIKVVDIEKICRQLVLYKLYPASMASLCNTLSIIQQLMACFAEEPDFLNYIGIDDCEESCLNVLKTVEKTLMVENCKNVQSMQSFENPIIKPGVSKELDDITENYDKSSLLFNNIRNVLNQLMCRAHGEGEYIKIHETEKSGLSLQITKKRGALLKTLLLNQTTIDFGEWEIVKTSDIKFVTASSSNDEIEFHLLTQVCKTMTSAKSSIDRYSAEAYLLFLKEFQDEYYQVLEKIAKCVGTMDVIQSKAFVAGKYNYCRPMIQESPKSFVDAKGLRHCLIEHIQQNEIYVPNDIGLGHDDSPSGILLYGTNAVGKTSMIRALGIAIIMAQAGFYVPCSQFVYSPYTTIFTRIVGNDNLFKGLSTFAVEMSELRTILKHADNKSMILGDELCSGTETESALSIFTAALMELHGRESSFIFATHFHEIIDYDEIRGLYKVALKHMAVHYDRELDCLVYDRKLQDGAGNRMYGLEVCKSLYLPDDFLENAYKIRNKYDKVDRGHLDQKKSHYNAKKIVGLCEMCKESMGEEVHHLQQQKDANDKGFIDGFHKNHGGNLMSICVKCHDALHQAEKSVKMVRKKTTRNKYVIDQKNV
jgi:DNA mismatch repair protein MutS